MVKGRSSEKRSAVDDPARPPRSPLPDLNVVSFGPAAAVQGVDGHARFLKIGPVQFVLFRCHFTEELSLDFVRQFLQDIFFQTAENEWQGQTAQVPACLFVVVPDDGQLKFGLKGSAGWQIAGHDEIEYRPQFVEGVFHRGAGQHKAAEGTDFFDSLDRKSVV